MICLYCDVEIKSLIKKVAICKSCNKERKKLLIVVDKVKEMQSTLAEFSKKFETVMKDIDETLGE